MHAQRIGLVAIILVSVVSVVVGFPPGVYRARTRPECRTGIPSHDYQSKQFRSLSAYAVSLPAVFLKNETARLQAVVESLPEDPETATVILPEQTADDPPRIKLFQLRQPRLQIDHCAVSRFALQLHEDGHWTLSLLANQNPWGPRRLHGESGTFEPRLYIQQNEFVIGVRFYGAFRTFRRDLDRVTGKPVIAEIDPIKFWVRSNKPKHVVLSTDEPPADGPGIDRLDISEEQFDLIDRIEVEFYYQ